MKIYTIILTMILSILLNACASTNSNLDELDRMELEDKQFMGDICKNPNY